jgi:Flp pilus assembly protein TadD
LLALRLRRDERALDRVASQALDLLEQALAARRPCVLRRGRSVDGRIGRAPSAELSYLATAKTLSGDPAGAEATMKAASELYPRSPFVLTRYSTLLDSHGNTAEAVSVFQRAKTINESAAKTWQAVIVSGPKALSELAARDKSYMQVMQLKPESSIYAVVTERYIKFPDEQRFSIFKATVKEP